jgi:hypothetical protein
MKSVNEKQGKIFFLNGPGGTGKTFVYKTTCHQAAHRAITLCSASSGIAALLMPGGRTSHSTFKIPVVGLNAESFCNIPKNSQRANLMRKTGLIFWDGMGMQDHMAIAERHGWGDNTGPISKLSVANQFRKITLFQYECTWPGPD